LHHQLFRTETQAFIDLVEIVQLTDSPEAARTSVSKYLGKLPKQCPTPSCMHDLNDTPFLCKGYRNPWHLFRMVDDEVKSVTYVGNALSTTGICNALENCNDARKEPCRECKSNRQAQREALDGVFCHGCGFFIDFEHQQIGYTQEWTICESLKLPPVLLGRKECVVCAASKVSLKFADYFFCSHDCFEEWLGEKEKVHTTSGCA
jgi:hypothetical protein